MDEREPGEGAPSDRHEAQSRNSVGERASDVIHELNNLLVTILGNAELLEQKLGQTRDDARDLLAHVAAIQRAGERASSLVGQRATIGERVRPLEEAPPPAPSDVYPESIHARILVVEDEPTVAQVMTIVLRNAGYSVEQDDDGAAALARIERDGIDFDLLVTDVVMPHVSGPELALRVRALRPDVGVLFVSGYPDDELDRYGTAGETIELLPKPFFPADLRARVARLLARRAAESITSEQP